eukprot:INCI2831.2.p1 GENE.INCI2831.2~~INCI2831.2.p1  ORF type:complete len:3523 (-),score=1017.86 INCI2831.2:32-9694(-)
MAIVDSLRRNIDEAESEADARVTELKAQLVAKKKEAAAEVKALNEKLQVLQEQVDELKDNAADASSSGASSQQALREKEVLLKRAEKLKAAAQEKLGDAVRDLEEAHEERQSLEENMGKARAMFQEKVDKLTARVQELETELADTNESFSMLQVEADMHKASALQNERFQEENGRLHDQLSQAEVRLAEQAHEADKAAAEAADVQAQLRRELQAAQEESDDLAGRLDEADDLAQELRERLAEEAEESAKAVARAAAENKELAEEVAALKAATRGQKKEASTEADNLRAQIHELERRLEEKDVLLSDALEENTKLVNDVSALRSQLDDVGADDVQKLRATVSTLSADLRREAARSAKLVADNLAMQATLREKDLLDEETPTQPDHLVDDTQSASAQKKIFEVGDIVTATLAGSSTSVNDRACCIVYEVFANSYGVRPVNVNGMQVEQVHADDVREAKWVRANDLHAILRLQLQQTRSGYTKQPGSGNGSLLPPSSDPSAQLKISAMQARLQSAEEALRNVQRDAVTAISAVASAGRGTASGEQLAAALRVFENRLATAGDDTQRAAMAQVAQQVANAEERIAADRDRAIAAAQAESEALVERLTATLADTRARFTDEAAELRSQLVQARKRCQGLEEESDELREYNTSIATRMQAVALLRLDSRRRTQQKQRALFAWQRAADIATICALRERCGTLEREKLRLIEKAIRVGEVAGDDDLDGVDLDMADLAQYADGRPSAKGQSLDDRLGVSPRARRASSPHFSFSSPIPSARQTVSNAAHPRRPRVQFNSPAPLPGSEAEDDALFDGLSAALATLELPEEYAHVLAAARAKAVAALRAVRGAAQEYRAAAAEALGQADALEEERDEAEKRADDLQRRLEATINEARKNILRIKEEHKADLHRLSKALQEAKQDEKQRAVAAVRTKYRDEALAATDAREADAAQYRNELARLQTEIADVQREAAEQKLDVERRAQLAVTEARQQVQEVRDELSQAHAGEMARVQQDREGAAATAAAEVGETRERLEQVRAELQEALAAHAAAMATSSHGAEVSQMEHDHVVRMKAVELQLALEEQRSRMSEEHAAALAQSQATEAAALAKARDEHAAELRKAQEQFTQELTILGDDSRELLLKKLSQQHTELADAHEARLAAMAAQAAEQAEATADEINRLAERHQGDLAATHQEFDEVLDVTGAASSVAAGDARHARRYQERQNAKMYRAMQVLAETEASAADAEELKKLTLESMVEALRSEVQETLEEADALEAEAEATDVQTRAQVEELHRRQANLQARLEQAAAAHSEQTQRLQMSAEERAAADRKELDRLTDACRGLEMQLAEAQRDVAVVSSVGLSQAETIAAMARHLLPANWVPHALPADGTAASGHGVHSETLQKTMEKQANAMDEVIEVARQCGNLQSANAALQKGLEDAHAEATRQQEEAAAEALRLQSSLAEAETLLRETKSNHRKVVSELEAEAQARLEHVAAEHSASTEASSAGFSEQFHEEKQAAAAAAMAMAEEHREHIAEVEAALQLRHRKAVTALQRELEKQVEARERNEAELKRATDAAHALSTSLSQQQLESVKAQERAGYQQMALEHELETLRTEAQRELTASKSAHSQSVNHLDDYRRMSAEQLASTEAEAAQQVSQLNQQLEALQVRLSDTIKEYREQLDEQRIAAEDEAGELRDALQDETTAARRLQASLQESLHHHEDELGQSTREREHVLSIQELTFDKERISLEGRCADLEREAASRAAMLADAQERLVDKNNALLKLERELADAQKSREATVDALQDELTAAHKAAQKAARKAEAEIAALRAQHAAEGEVLLERARNTALLHEAALAEAGRVHEREAVAAREHYEALLQRVETDASANVRALEAEAQRKQAELGAAINASGSEVESLRIAAVKAQQAAKEELRAAHQAAHDQLQAAEQRAAKDLQIAEAAADRTLLEEQHQLTAAKAQMARDREATEAATRAHHAAMTALENDIREINAALQQQKADTELQRTAGQLRESELRAQLLAERKDAVAEVSREFQAQLADGDRARGAQIAEAAKVALAHATEKHTLEKQLLSLEAQHATAMQRSKDLEARLEQEAARHEAEQDIWAATEAELRSAASGAAQRYEDSQREALEAFEKMRGLLESRIETLELRRQRQEKDAAAAATELAEIEDRLSSTEQEAERQIEQLQARGAAMSSALDELRDETNHMSQELAKAERRHAAEVASLTSQHERSIREQQADAERVHTARVSALESELAQVRMEHAYQVKAKEAEVVQMHMQHLAAMDSQQATLRAQAKDAAAEAALARQRDVAVHSETVQHLEHIAETKGAQADQLLARAEQLAEQLQQLQAEHRAANLRNSEVCAQLEQELVEAQAAAAAETARMQTAFASELSETQAEASSKLEATEAAHSAQCKALTLQAAAQLKAAETAAAAAADETSRQLQGVEAMAAQSQAKVDELSIALQQARADGAEVRTQLEVLTGDHAQQVSFLREKLAGREQAEAALAQQLQEAQATAAARTEVLTSEIGEARAAAAATEARMHKTQLHFHQQLAETTTKWEAERASIRATADQEASSLREQLSATNAEHRVQLEEQRHAATRSLAELEATQLKKLATYEASVQAQQKEVVDSLQASFREELSGQHRKHTNQLKEERAAAALAMEKARAAHDHQLRLLEVSTQGQLERLAATAKEEREALETQARDEAAEFERCLAGAEAAAEHEMAVARRTQELQQAAFEEELARERQDSQAALDAARQKQVEEVRRWSEKLQFQVRTHESEAARQRDHFQLLFQSLNKDREAATAHANELRERAEETAKHLQESEASARETTERLRAMQAARAQADAELVAARRERAQVEERYGAQLQRLAREQQAAYDAAQAKVVEAKELMTKQAAQSVEQAVLLQRQAHLREMQAVEAKERELRARLQNQSDKVKKVREEQVLFAEQAKVSAERLRNELVESKSAMQVLSSDFQRRLERAETAAAQKERALEASVHQATSLSTELEQLRAVQQDLALQAELAEADRAHFEELHDSAVRIAQSNLMQDRQSAIDVLNDEFGKIMHQSMLTSTQQQQLDGELRSRERQVQEVPSERMGPPASKWNAKGPSATPRSKMTVDQLQLPTPQGVGGNGTERRGFQFAFPNPDASFLAGSAQTPLPPASSGGFSRSPARSARGQASERRLPSTLSSTVDSLRKVTNRRGKGGSAASQWSRS